MARIILESLVRSQHERQKDGTQTALQMPATNPKAIESATEFMARVAQMDVNLCPCCKAGVLRVVARLAGRARLPSPDEWISIGARRNAGGLREGRAGV